jgi:hypothetical protein
MDLLELAYKTGNQQGGNYFLSILKHLFQEVQMGKTFKQIHINIKEHYIYKRLLFTKGCCFYMFTIQAKYTEHFYKILFLMNYLLYLL